MFLRFPKRINVPLVCYICLIIGIIGAHWIWFFSGVTLTSGDWGFIHKGQGTDWLPFPSIWSTPNLGSLNVFFANSPVEWALRLLTDRLSYGVALRAVYLIPTVLLSVVSVHLLANELRFSIPAKIAAVSTYLCSTPMIISRTGHNTLAAAYAVAPMIIVTFKRSLEKPISFSTLLTPILCTLMSAYEPRAFYLILFILGLLTIHFFIASYDLKRLIGGCLTIIFIGTFYVLLSAYWLLPFIQLSSGAGEGVLGRSLFGSHFASILGFMSLHHPFWNGGKYESFVVQTITPVFFLIPILLLCGLMVARKSFKIIPFVVVLLIGIFLGKQENAPFGSIYEALYLHFPGFSAFRESSKFYFYVTLATAVIVGNLFDVSFRAKSGFNLKSWTKYFLGLICLTCLVFLNSLNLIPLATGEMGRMFVARHMPSDYQILNDYLTKVKGTYRIVAIPGESRWIVKSDRTPIISLYDSIGPLTKNLPQISKIGPYEEKISAFLQTSEFARYLNSSSSRYVVVPLRDTMNDDDFYLGIGNNRNIFLNAIDRVSYLRRVHLDGMTEVRLYENPFYEERITTEHEGKPIATSFIFINSSNYNINMSNVTSERVKIDFHEKYDANWKVYQQVSLSDKSIPQKHQADQNGHNIFSIDIYNLCKEGILQCKRSKEGYSVTLSILYAPQLYVRLGYISTLCTLGVLILGGVMLTYYRYIHKQRLLKSGKHKSRDDELIDSSSHLVT